MQFTLQTGDKQCEVHVGDVGSLLHLLLPAQRCIFITDDNVYRIYREFFSNRETIVIQSGEAYKSIETVYDIYLELIEMGADRKTFLVGMGGGVVTDIAGFVASTYMRGLDFGFISTTLLGQIDAVIGGKNGVNIDRFKNMAGTFSQPAFIINDPSFFHTLPENEFINGSAELIKHFLIADAEGFEYFRQNFQLFEKKEPQFLADLIFRHNQLKAKIVEADETEQGIRKILNFGHTLGHAIERETQIPHGFAISQGMVLETRISQMLGFTDIRTVNEVISILEACRLPVRSELPMPSILSSIRSDKKKSGENIDFIFLESIGKAGIHSISLDSLENLLKQIIN
jgi:3-dehydroquinate synthase